MNTEVYVSFQSSVSFFFPDIYQGVELLDHMAALSFPGGKSGIGPTCQCPRPKRHGLILGLGRSHGGGHGNLLQYFYLENPMDR